MAKSKLRRLKIGDNNFLWTVKALYLPRTDVTADYPVQVKFTAFLESYKTTALHIHFKTSSTVAGNWLTSGIGEVNLHLPSFARLLIVGGMEQGWQARYQTLNIENGLPILRRAGYNIKDE
ncbi:hypothetical protein [Undibacterium pigrum]|uniref:Uncharacterized protein n=1 Tax=Undibacterium pigrum TaxID=401470 RepID=A0A318IU59_9BURK|nr:hypothetical protein [Undibacterium pigrum]PXX39696.1 hypothetical protein DFR42_11061 [Undibacterium pigrum]